MLKATFIHDQPNRRDAARLPALDGLRGCLAAFVCLHHVASYLWLGGLSYIGSQMAVLAFFALSGCVLARTWQDRFPTFLARRFVRLWPVFALGVAGGAALQGRWPDPGTLLWLPPLGPRGALSDPPAWSLFIEAWAMLAFPFVVWSCSGRVWRLGAAVLVFAGGAWSLDWRLIYGLVFVAGALGRRLEWGSAVLEQGWAQFLGRISYSLYLTHWLVLAVAVRQFGNGAAALALPAMLFLAWLTWRLLERPSIVLSRRIRLPELDRSWRRLSRANWAASAGSRQTPRPWDSCAASPLGLPADTGRRT